MMQASCRLIRLPFLLQRCLNQSVISTRPASKSAEPLRKAEEPVSVIRKHGDAGTRGKNANANELNAAPSSSTAFTNAAKITFSSSAVNKMKQFDPAIDGYLRLIVDGGGCAGFTSRFELDKKLNESEDFFIEQDGVKMVVDEASLPFVNGSVVDFQHELIRSGFRILTNPNAEKRCSCGTSFSLKETDLNAAKK